MTNKLAIVIPFYKIEFFDECLSSVAQQSDKRFTVYIGDDASPESPKPIIAKYADSLNLHYKRFESNIGRTHLTKQWDRCIDLTKDEEWIMLLGDDDEISTDMVAKFYEHLTEIESLNLNLIRSNVTEIDDKSGVLRTFVFPKKELALDAFLKKISSNYHISLPEYFFRRRTYEKFGFKHFPFAYGSDNVAWIEFSEGRPIFTLPEAVCYVRYSSVSISGNNSGKKDKIYAMYLTKKYILSKFAGAMDDGSKTIMISRAYKDLLYSRSKDYFERIVFILKNARHLSFSDFYKTFIKG